MYKTYSPKDLRRKIFKNITEIHFLSDKGLYDIAYKKVEKTLQIAIQHEFFDFIPSILYLQYSLLFLEKSPDVLDEKIAQFSSVYQEEIEELSFYFHTLKLSAMQRSWLLRSSLSGSKDYLIEQHETILNDKILQKRPLRFRQALTVQNLIISSSEHKMNNQENYTAHQEKMKICETHNKLGTQSEDYLLSIGNSAWYASEMKNEKLFFENLSKLKAFSSPNNLHRQKKAKLFAFLYEVNFYLDNNRYKDALKLVKAKINTVPKADPKIKVARFLAIKSYFINNDFKNASYWGNKILSNKKTYSLRKDITNATLVMDCFLSYELFAQNQLEYDEMLKKIDKHHKTLKKLMEEDEKTERYETFIIKKFKRIVNGGINKQEHIEQFKRLQKESATYLKENPHAVAFSAFFNIPAWLNSKIQGISLAESYCSF